MRLTRNRGSKRLRNRTGNGRFARSPNVESLFGMANCENCGRFFEATTLREGPFLDKVQTTHCPHCGAEKGKKLVAEVITVAARATPGGRGFTAYVLNGDKVLAECKHDHMAFGDHDGEYYARRCSYELVGRLFAFLDLVRHCSLVAGGTTKLLKPCPDCAVAAGELHTPGCDMEICSWCGYQAIGCNCVYEVNTADPEDGAATQEMWEEFGKLIDANGGPIPWDGENPWRAACRRLGFWYYDDYTKPQGPDRMVRCGPDRPEASEDLNRLYEGYAVWNRTERQWEAR